MTLTGILLVLVASYALSALIAYVIFILKPPAEEALQDPALSTPKQTTPPGDDFTFLEQRSESSPFVTRADEDDETEANTEPAEQPPVVATVPPKQDVEVKPNTPVRKPPAEPKPLPRVEQTPQPAPRKEPPAAPKTEQTAKSAPPSVAKTERTPAPDAPAGKPAPRPPIEEIARNLMDDFVLSYRKADLNGLERVLDSNVKANDISGRSELLDSYRKLFDITSDRHIRFYDMGWFGDAREFVGQGKFEITLRQKGKNTDTHYEGRIFVQARDLNGKIVIQEMNYTYKNQ